LLTDYGNVFFNFNVCAKTLHDTLGLGTVGFSVGRNQTLNFFYKITLLPEMNRPNNLTSFLGHWFVEMVKESV
jgi:hypothetical protein